MPDELREKIAEEAEKQDRSLNNMIVKILKDYFLEERRAGR